MQESGVVFNKGMESTDQLIDKTVAEDQLISPLPKEKEGMTVNSSNRTKSREFQTPSDQTALDSKERFDLENKLFDLICEDNSLKFISTLKCIRKANVPNFTDADGKAKCKDYENMISHILPKLLHLACKLDSVTCAKAILEGETGYSVAVNAPDEHGKTALHHAADTHSLQCINLLLRKQARTDLKSRDSQIPLDMALACKRMQVDWSLSSTIGELLTLIGHKDITAVRVLAANTKGVPQIAYRKAVDGHIVAFAVLVIVATDLILSALVLSHEEPHIHGTIFEFLVKKAISIWQIEAQSSNNNNNNDADKGSTGSIPDSGSQQQRKVLLSEIELLVHFEADITKPKDSNRLNSHASFLPLIRASQAGDEAIVKLLLNGNIDPNDTDSDGNTALHFCLRATATTQDTRIVYLLLRYGASVRARNRLGLTPVHMAANYGHLQGLQILLLRDSETVDMVTEMKETPLFYAVKNNHVECALLLLRYGANRQALNLRKQRPIDMAKSQDMRVMLNSQSVFQFGKLKEYLTSTSSPEIIHCLQNEKPLDNSPNFQLIKAETSDQVQAPHEESSQESIQTKTEICRYYESPGGCVRGDKCYFAHGEGELRRINMLSGDLKQTTARPLKRIPDDLNKKIFIGGLSPSVESEDLRDFFESKFGPVVDAVVIGTQAGEQIHSRGFGFVTFKYEDSVAAAVQAHYVSIFGKKVEIKGAVPKSMLSTLELLKGNIHEDPLSSKQVDHVHQDDTEGRGRKLSISASEERKEGVQITPPCPPAEYPPWVDKFKRWLPEFLGEVSKRLQEGEWYPLSSLKGDFRATCGLELDHISLGYSKLSDFIRSMPGLCRMKIVPVGRGPATHMVLLESLPKAQQQKHHSLSGLPTHQQTIGSSSFVDKGRSYAAAAGHNVQGSSVPENNPLPLTRPPSAGDVTGFYGKALASSQPICSNNPLLSHQSTTKSKFPIRTDEDVRYLTNLLSVFNLNADGTAVTSTNLNPLVNSSHSSMNQYASIPQAIQMMDTRQQSPYDMDTMHIAPMPTPVQSNRPPITASPASGQGYSFVNFLQEGSSFFTPWSQQVPSYGGESHSWTPTHSRKIWETSPQSVLSPYSPPDSSSQISPQMDSPSEIGGNIKINCGLCKERKAFWVAVPCAHRVLCTECRNNLKISQMPLNCFICGRPVHKLVALY